MMMNAANRKAIRVDLQVIADMIPPNSRVLDVGCGDGALLEYLVHFKQVDGRGIEISTAGVNACVSNGLSVVQGDADVDLEDYPDKAFDFVVLSQTLQAMHQPRETLNQLLRIGDKAIVSFPNFGHWRVRWDLLLRGRMPVSDTLPHEWFDTPNIHLCTIKDFIALSRAMGITVLKSLALDHQGQVRRISGHLFSSNLIGEQAVFLLRSNGT